MQRITDYKVITSLEGIQTLESLVTEAIVQGWQPIGGVSVTEIALPFDPQNVSKAWIQAMAKYE